MKQVIIFTILILILSVSIFVYTDKEKVKNSNSSIKRKPAPSLSDKNLLGDPSFEYAGRLGADNWFTPNNGTTQEGFSFFTTGSLTEITEKEKVNGNSSLHIKGNATVISSRFINTGGKITLKGYIKTKGITIGKEKWCKAGVQLVYYDTNGHIWGHDDLKLLAGDNDWQEYTFSTYLSPRTADFEIWIRIFEGANGDAWFDDFFLSREQSSRKPYNPKSAKITINANNIDSDIINPVWANGVILYPGWILHPVGQHTIKMAHAADFKSIRVFDILQGGRVIKKIDTDGSPVYSWERLDATIDSLVTHNLTPLLTIETTPNQISTHLYKNNNIYANRYPPKDYDLWQEIVEKTLTHLIKRYGKANVSQWHFDIWNEPGATTYFKGTFEEYLKVYDHALDALLHIEKKFDVSLKKGTMSGIRHKSFRPLFEHLHSKGTLQYVDYLSFHIYAGTKTAFISFKNEINIIKDIRDSYNELRDKPLILSEYNGNTMPGGVYRDNQVLAALLIKCSRVFLDTGIESAYFHSLIDYPHNRYKNIYFHGAAAFVSKSGIPYPSYNAFLLLNKLRNGQRIPLETTNEPVDGIAVIGSDGSLRIITTSFDEAALDSNDQLEINISTSWKNAPDNIHASLMRIDQNHANAYTEYLALGKPPINHPDSNIHKMRMLQASKLRKENFNDFSYTDNILKIKLKMERNAVSYLEFK